MPHHTSTSGTVGHHAEPFEHRKHDVKEVQEDRRAVRMIRDFMERSSTYRERHLILARQSRELYENWHTNSKSIIQRANLKLPFGFTIIETQLPQIMDIFFRGGSPVQFQGQDYQDAKWEDLITDFHTHQYEEMDFQSKAAGFKKSMLLDGTAFAKVPYVFKEIKTVRREMKIDPRTGEPKQIKFPVTEREKDGPDLENIPIYDFYPDWQVRTPGNIKDMRGCVHRMFKTINSLRRSKIKYRNLDQAERSVSAKGPNAWSPPFFFNDNFKEDFEHLQDNPHSGIKDPGKIEIWEYWGLYDPKGEGKFEEYIITIANGDVVIRIEENFYDYKFKPFVACPNYIRPNEFYGIPELLAVRTLIKEANTLRNARLDNINLSVNPMWLVDRASSINSKALYSRPNGIIWTNDMSGIKPLQIPDPSNGSLREMQEIQQDIQNTTALVNAAPAISQLGKQFGRSATGVNFIQSFSGARISLKARMLSDLFYKRVAWIMLMTNRQFVTKDKWVRVSDPNAPNPFETLPTDAFFRKFDFIVKTTLDTGGPEGQLQKLQGVAQIIQAFESSQPGTVKADVLLEALLRPLIGRQTKKFVRDDEERAAIQQQQLAQEQAVNAAQGQNAPQPNVAGAAPQVQPILDTQENLGIGE